ncbi:MAG: ribonuclease III [Rhodobacteraceae bacterium]|nr:MAG: ribonuclease III [Paracoccaceae bacterium]
MKLSASTTAFIKRLGHPFTRPELLHQALTHSSLSTTTRPDNQRLEFLGDRVLGLVIAEALLIDDMEAREGKLAPRLNALVRKETCAEVAEGVDLGAALMLGRSEMLSGGRKKTALLGDAMEAVIAAVYLDAGYDAAKDLVLRLWGNRIAHAEENAADPKSDLQEWAQARRMPPPIYAEIERSGPDHAPVFVIEAQLKNGKSARATAPSKRAAQQLAAAALLKELEA